MSPGEETRGGSGAALKTAKTSPLCEREELRLSAKFIDMIDLRRRECPRKEGASAWSKDMCDRLEEALRRLKVFNEKVTDAEICDRGGGLTHCERIPLMIVSPLSETCSFRERPCDVGR